MRRAAARAVVRLAIFILAFYGGMLLIRPFTAMMNQDSTAMFMLGLLATFATWAVLAGGLLWHVAPAWVDLWRLFESWFHKRNSMH